MTEPEAKRQRTDEELKGMGVNELIALFKEAEEGRLAAEEDNRANQAKLYRLAMIAGKVPWVQCRTRADGSDVKRLVNFDLTGVPAMLQTNALLASIDAAGQIFATRRMQEILIPADHYDNDARGTIDAEVALVKEHLAALTVQVRVEPFDKPSEQASLAISQSFENVHTLRFNQYIFARDLVEGQFTRIVVAGTPTSTHEPVHSKGRIDNIKSNTPPKLFSAGAKRAEAGHYVEEQLFGGEILPCFGKGGDEQAKATKATTADPSLFDRPLRFAPATTDPRSYYQVDDVWAAAFVRDIADGALAARIDAAATDSIPLLPKTVHSGAYKPPTPAEIRALCYRPNLDADLAQAEKKLKKAKKK